MKVFQQIKSGKSSNEVAHQIENLVLEGVLRSGDQLPPERELAIEMGISRPVLREAIERLENRKILQRRQGDGTFVANIIGQVFTDPIASILPKHRKATIDYLEYRREIEGIAAEFAARRATKFDIEMLKKCLERMELAHTKRDFQLETEIDVEFHSLIGEMAHNLVLLHTLRSCYRLLSEGVFQNRSKLYERPGGRQALFDQHVAIAEAVMAGDAELARSSARDHLTYVIHVSKEMEQEMERERISGLRFNQREMPE
jgi:GntR family transcriptional repressor for pyruvate dehydrogenase complex